MPKNPVDRQVYITILLAFVFWYLTFSAKWLNFWLSMSMAAFVLTALSVYFAGFVVRKQEVNVKNVLIGIVSAGMLYAIYAAGNYMSQQIFYFARPEIASIYDIRHEGNALMIAMVLLFITSPAEELFWRGFLQRWAVNKFGQVTGWLVAAAVYGAVHILSGNFMLTMAAWIAGLFWGFLYLKTDSIFACIISHALWTVSIFILWPMM
ncbi:hypothetical protein EV210_10596 [Anaerospora hongkongensis]|uniref:CAAX prenyl protease 2/Lysostaphin resistance protein A-like domain-containing protein n=1 Tax=Anaerospora hongkongensis TaxID=244830 RepID=A0A4R1PY10_9FIRM|nr:type II CAAX endopeptidase family protein [Anaerospora hongkongensis]TCL37662.1 hypothetical protein EV210_10596 [Anaerospora hongkongensis]